MKQNPKVEATSKKVFKLLHTLANPETVRSNTQQKLGKATSQERYTMLSSKIDYPEKIVTMKNKINGLSFLEHNRATIQPTVSQITGGCLSAREMSRESTAFRKDDITLKLKKILEDTKRTNRVPKKLVSLTKHKELLANTIIYPINNAKVQSRKSEGSKTIIHSPRAADILGKMWNHPIITPPNESASLKQLRESNDKLSMRKTYGSKEDVIKGKAKGKIVVNNSGSTFASSSDRFISKDCETDFKQKLQEIKAKTQKIIETYQERERRLVEMNKKLQEENDDLKKLNALCY